MKKGIATSALMGRVVSEPEKKVIGEHTKVSFRLAVNEIKKGEEYASYFPIDAWGKTADLLANLSVGEPVHLSVRISQERWEDDKGNKRSTYRFTVTDFVYLPSKKDSNGGGESGPAEEPPF